MPEFNVRSDSVNVEQIMEQIRARIREKRGVDYTEQQIRDLAAVKLEKFLDPKGVRSDLLEQFRRVQPAYEPPELPNYEFEESTLYETHRGPLRFIRKLLNPLLKLFFNPNKVTQALHIQAKLNTMYAEREARREAARRATDQLTYELIHNLVVETTRLGIEVKNLKMRAESLSSRVEFNERRARALESVVVYKPADGDIVATEPAPRADVTPMPAASASQHPQQSRQAQQAPHPPQGPPMAGGAQGAEGPGQRSRRRRRRRGRRGGGSAAAIMTGEAGAPAPAATAGQAGEAAEAGEPEEAGEAEERLAQPVATEALDQFTGAPVHPVEPVPRPPDSSDSDPDAQ